MARHRRSSKLEAKAARLRLETRRKPYFLQVAPRVGLGYRRTARWLHGGGRQRRLARFARLVAGWAGDARQRHTAGFAVPVTPSSGL